jgi:cytochrome c
MRIKMSKQLLVSTAAAAMFTFSAMAQAAAPNAAAGQIVYKSQCAMCHATVAGKNGLGPSLSKISGRKPAAISGFSYSPAMKAAAGKWDAATLDRFVSNPRAVMPGTRMIYAGQKDATKRADLIAYLATLK